MENSRNILTKRSENYKTAEALEAKANSMPWNKRTEPEAVALYERAEALKIANAILKDNARRAYIAEVLPAIKEAFAKFDGKQYGEKTRGKINAELTKTAGCRVYISSYASLHNDLCIIPMGADGYNSRAWDTNDFTLTPIYKNGEYSAELVDKGNTIHAGAVDNLRLCNCSAYVEDVAEAVAEIMDAKRNADNAKRAAEEAASKYNALIPSSMKRIHYSVY